MNKQKKDSYRSAGRLARNEEKRGFKNIDSFSVIPSKLLIPLGEVPDGTPDGREFLTSGDLAANR